MQIVENHHQVVFGIAQRRRRIGFEIDLGCLEFQIRSRGDRVQMLDRVGISIDRVHRGDETAAAADERFG